MLHLATASSFSLGNGSRVENGTLGLELPNSQEPSYSNKLHSESSGPYFDIGLGEGDGTYTLLSHLCPLSEIVETSRPWQGEEDQKVLLTGMAILPLKGKDLAAWRPESLCLFYAALVAGTGPRPCCRMAALPRDPHGSGASPLHGFANDKRVSLPTRHFNSRSFIADKVNLNIKLSHSL